MTLLNTLARRGTIAVAAFGMAGALAAPAAQAKPTESIQCFYSRDWQGWSAPDPNTILIRVNRRDVYSIHLSGGSSELQSPNVHLIFVAHGGDTICSHLDLDLSVSDGHGFTSPLIARSITKLTPEEAAAIPKKYQP